MAGGSIALAGLTSFPSSVFGTANSFYPPVSNTLYKVNREITEEKLATTYTNFYEFGSSKNIWRRAALLKTKPWMLTIDGLVKKPVTIDISDLLKKVGGIEERVYRFRCVEAWSMTVPWSGFSVAPSGITMPDAVVRSSSRRFTITRSCKGRIFISYSPNSVFFEN